jgi:hypothetical protein
MSEYPVGTVAMATVRGVEGVRIFLDGAGAGWTSAILVDGQCWHRVAQVTDIRPLIVLDPEDERVKEFLDLSIMPFFPPRAAPFAALIREQIAPPRIEEPGPWGVVEAGPSQRRTQWVHYWGAGDRARWRNLSSGQETSTWEDIIEPTLIRPGIEATR